jgi:hypothetical protein
MYCAHYIRGYCYGAKYEKVKGLLTIVEQLRAEGKTRKEIAKKLGLQRKGL